MNKHFVILSCLIISLVWSLFPACKDKGGIPSAYLSGKAYYTPLSGSGSDTLPLAGRDLQVVIVQTGVTYHLHTDTAGNFAMPGLSPSDTVKITATLNLDDTAQYHVVCRLDTTISGGKINNLYLQAIIDTLHNTTLKLVVTDKHNGIIPGASVLGYFSGEIATPDDGYNGFDANIKLTTNKAGECLLMQLPSIPLYIRSQYKADTGKVLLRSGIDTIPAAKIKTGSLTIDTIKLK